MARKHENKQETWWQEQEAKNSHIELQAEKKDGKLRLWENF